MGFWDNVKKKTNDVWSGADFWDSQENRVQRNNAATGRNDVYRPSVPTAKPAQTFFDKVRDVADSNSAMDIYKRTQAKAPAIYAEQQKSNGVGQNSIATTPIGRVGVTGKAMWNGFKESPEAFGQYLASGSNEVLDARKADQMLLQSDKAAVARARATLLRSDIDQAQRQRTQKFLDWKTGKGDNTAQINANTAEWDKQADPKRALIAGADMAFTTATLGVGGGGYQAVKGAIKGAAPGFKNAAVAGGKELAKYQAMGATVAAPSGAASTVINNPEATNKQILQGAGLGALVGAALPTAGVIAAPIAKPLARATGKGIVKVTKGGARAVTKGANKTLDAADNARWSLKLEEVKAIDKQIIGYQRAYDLETNPKLRNQISKGISDLTAERRKLTEGGYLAGGRAKSFTKRKAAGEVFEAPGGERFEGSDEGIKITGLSDSTGRETTVGDLIDHPKFFEDYPWLKDMRTTIARGMDSNQYGGYDAKSNTMVLNRNLSLKDKLNTIMHELNHAVDNYEGFKGGGNPNHPKLAQVVKDRIKAQGGERSEATIRSTKASMQTQYDKLAALEASGVADPAARKAIGNSLAKLQKTLEKEQSKKTERQIRFIAYEDLAGETGSRTVGNRVGMPDKDRALRPFMADYDTDNPKNIIVTKNDGSDYGKAVQEDVTGMIPKVGKDAPPARKEWVHPAVQVGAPLPGGKKVTKGRVRINRPYRSREIEVTPPGPQQKYNPVQVENGLRTQTATAFVDKDAPLIKVLKRMEAQTGVKGLVERFYYDSGLQSRANSIANNKMATSESLKAAMAGLGRRQLKEFNEYAGARAELNMAQRGMKTSKPQAELEKIVAELGEEYGERFTSLNKFYKERAKDLFDAGIIDGKKYNEFIASDDYIRIQRDFDELVGRSGGTGNGYTFGRSLTSFKRKGSQRELLDTDQVTFEYTQQIQKEIQRNQTSTNLIDTLGEFGMVKRLKTGETANKNTIKRVVNGKTEVYEIDPILKGVVDNIRPYSLNGLERIIGAPARLFRAGTTALSAPFSAANYMRDQAGSAINSTDVMATHIRHPQNIFTGLWEAGKDFGIGENNSPMWQKFIAHAGDTTQYDLTRNVRDTRMLSRELRFGQAGRGANAIMHPIRTLEDFNAITEKATRYQNFKGMYQKVLEETNDPDMAMQRATVAAWQNSIDFNRAGNVGRFANLLIPYFNAGIQGTRQMGKSFTRSPQSAIATTAKAIGIVGMPLYAATAWNLSDPDRKEIYDNLNEYEKENNVIYIMPWTKQNEQGGYNVLKFPLPPGFKDLVMPGRRAMESFANKEPNAWGEMANDLLQAVAGPLQVESPTKAVTSLIPQMFKPSVHQIANKDFFTGTDIVPSQIEEATDKDGNPIAEELKARDFTSGTSKLIGGAIDQSPIRVEKFLKDTFGSVGQYGVNAADQVLAGKLPGITSLTGIGSGLNVIDEEEIGGKNAIEDITRRFTEATAKENNNASEGTKYFKDVEKILPGFNGNTRKSWEAIHPSRKNFLGETLTEKSIVDSGVKAGTYIADPQTFEIDRQLDSKQRERGRPGNPIYDLEPSQLRTLLSLQANKAFNPNDKALPDVIENQNPWIKDYYNKSSEYFDQVEALKVKETAEAVKSGKKTQSSLPDTGDPNGIPKPVAPTNLDQLFDVVGQITDPAQKAAFYEQNPELSAYLSQNEDYKRAKAAFLGLPQLDRFPKDPAAEALQEQYFGMDKESRKGFIKSNPALSDYWLRKNLWQLNDAGARARYEGEELDEDSVKDIMSIAQSLRNAGGSGGSGGGGSSYGGRTYELRNRVDAPTVKKVALTGNVRVTRNKSTPGKITVKRGGRI